MAFQLIKYKRITIQGLVSWGRLSLFAMSTQGIRHLALFLLAGAVCRPVALTAVSPSLETQESTSRGLDAEPPPELSTARM